MKSSLFFRNGNFLKLKTSFSPLVFFYPSEFSFFSAKVSQLQRIHTHIKPFFQESQKIRDNLEANKHNFKAMKKIFYEYKKIYPIHFKNDYFYRIIITEMAKYGMCEDLVRFLEEMKEEGHVLSNYVYRKAIETFGRNGKINFMMQFFQEMKRESKEPISIFLYNQILDFLLKNRFYDEVVKFFQEEIKNSSRVIPDVLTFNLYLKALFQLKDIKTLKHVFREMQKTVTPDTITYNTVLNALGTLDSIESMKKFFDDMIKKRNSISIVTLNILIKNFGNQGQVEEVYQIFQFMKSNGFKLDIYTFNSLFAIWTMHNDTIKLFETFEEMLRRHIFPDEIALRTIFRFLVKKRMILELRNIVQNPSFRIRVFIWRYILTLLGASNLVEDLRQIFEIMKKTNAPDLFCYTTLIINLCKISDYDSIFKTLEEMEQRNIMPSNLIFNNILSRAMKEGNIKVLEKSVQMMKDKSISFDAYTFNILIYSYGKQKNLDKMFYYLKQMQEQNIALDTTSYNTLFTILFKFGKFEIIQPFIQQMKANKVPMDKFTYSLLLNFFAKNEEFEEMFSLLSEMKSQKIPLAVVNYGSIIHALGSTGDLQEMMNYFHEMLNQDPPILPNLQIFNSMIQAFGKRGKLDEMFQLYEDMKKNKIIPDSITHSFIIQALGKYETLDKLLTFLQQIMYKDIVHTDTLSYNTALNILGKMQKYDIMRELIQFMEKKNIPFDLITYNVIINHLGKAHLIDEMISYFEKLSKSKYRPDVITYTSFLSSLIQSNREDLAKKYLIQFRTTFPKLDHFTYNYQLKFYIFLKDWEKFKATFYEMKEAGAFTSFALINLTRGCISFNEFDFLKIVLDEFYDLKYKDINLLILCSLIIAHLKLDELDKAISIFEHYPNLFYQKKAIQSFIFFLPLHLVPLASSATLDELKKFYCFASTQIQKELHSQMLSEISFISDEESFQTKYIKKDTNLEEITLEDEEHSEERLRKGLQQEIEEDFEEESDGFGSDLKISHSKDFLSLFQKFLEDLKNRKK